MFTDSHFVGNVDGIANGEVSGWALDVAHPSKPVKIAVYLNAEFAATALAGYYRPDVAKALNCSGRQGFYVDIDPLCKNHEAMSVDVRYEDGRSIDGAPLFYHPPANPSISTDPTLLFMHIPKTAGTAFREVVLPNYKQSQVAYIYGDPPGFPSICLRDLPLAQRSRLRLVFGHFGYGTHVDIPNECKYAALIREPLARIWSHYTHLVRADNETANGAGGAKPIEEVLERRESAHLDNVYVRYFCGVEEKYIPATGINRELYELAAVNIAKPNIHLQHQSDLASTYDEFAEQFGWTRGLRCPRLNLSPQPDLLPTHSQEKAIRHFNRWDFKLYQGICQKLSSMQAEKCPASTSRKAGTIWAHSGMA